MGRTRAHLAARRRIAANLERLFTKSGMTQEELAAEAGVSRTLLYETLNADRGVGIDSLARIADALGCDLVDLVKK